MSSMPEKYKIVALCDYDIKKSEKYKKLFGTRDENVFDNDDEFFEKKRSDVLVIATWDNDHVAIAKRAIPLGYKILLEKPISDKLGELIGLRELAKNTIRLTWCAMCFATHGRTAQ